MIKEIKSLRKEAEESCKSRNHEINWQKETEYSNRITQIGICRACEMEVMINTNPAPNDIDISGEAVALGCLEFIKWNEKIWKEKIDECFKNKGHQIEVVEALYQLIYPDWDNIKSIGNKPTVGKGISEYIYGKAMAFDRKQHPNAMQGGLWFNKGWSTDEKMDRWSIDMSTAEVEY